jgi:hypothetical protein
MPVVAITTINHGEPDGTVKVFGVGDKVDLPEENLRSLVEGGSAVEVGSGDKKYNSPYYTDLTSGGAAADVETVKRDMLIARAAGLEPAADSVEDAVAEGTAGTVAAAPEAGGASSTDVANKSSDATVAAKK